MMSQTSPRFRRSNLWLRWTQHSRKRGLRSTIRKTQTRLDKAEERLLLLEAETRHQLLLIKELGQILAASHHRIEELNPTLNQLAENQLQGVKENLLQLLATAEQSNQQ